MVDPAKTPVKVIQLLPGSRLYLHELETPPGTLLDFMCAVYPHVSPEAWGQRADRGMLTWADGTAITRTTPYLHGETVRYEREVVDEPDALLPETIVYEDERILVADKPQGMPVTPAGEYFDRSLLIRLKKRTGIHDLVPAHRLDRDTAGIVLFVKQPADRGLYHSLWSQRRVDRQYHALAGVPQKPERTRWVIENRIESGTPWFRQRVTTGRPNAVTEIELSDRHQGIGLFHIRPQTGKKHQIRVHMAEIGYPILGDPLYPEMIETPEPTASIQLIAARLSFTDPVTGRPQSFASATLLGCRGFENGASKS